MPSFSSLPKGHVLKGFAPSIVRTNAAAHELAEARFTRLGGFDFESAPQPRLVSSGVRDADRSICLVASSGHNIILRDDAKVFCLFPFTGTVTVEHGDSLETAGPSEMIVVGPGQRRTRLSTNYVGGMIHIPLADMEGLDERLDEPPQPARHLDSVRKITAALPIGEAHNALERLERQGAEAAHGLWLRMVRPLWEALRLRADDDGVRPASLSQVQRAEELMAAHSAQQLSLIDIALAANVGPRALQTAFKRHRRRTPLQFLYEQRLAAARGALVTGDPSRTVTKVAIDCGFTHLSRFSDIYRQAFGETPSATRRQALASHGRKARSLSG